MPNAIFMTKYVGALAQANYTTKEEILAALPGMRNQQTASEDQIKDSLQEIFPEAPDLFIQDPETRNARRALSEQAAQLLFELAADYHLKPAGEVDRIYINLFQAGDSPQIQQHNQKLSKAINDNDFQTQAEILMQHLDNLPEYDRDQLPNLTDQQVVEGFSGYRALYLTAMEAENYMKKSQLMGQLPAEYQKKLQSLKNDIALFGSIQLRFETICDPHYALIDVDKLVAADQNHLVWEGEPKTLSAGMDIEDDGLRSFLEHTTSQTNNVAEATDAYLFNYLRQQNVPLQGIQTFASDMTQYAVEASRSMPSCSIPLLKGMPIVYRGTDGQVGGLVMSENTLHPIDPTGLVANSCSELLTTHHAKVDSMLNSREADPFWMLTGSKEYKAMKRSSAAISKLMQEVTLPLEGEQLEQMRSALEAAKASSEAYMRHKGMDPAEIVNMNSYRFYCSENKLHPSSQESARVEAALALRDMTQRALQAVGLQGALNHQEVVVNNGNPDYAMELPTASHNGRELTGTADLRRDILNGVEELFECEEFGPDEQEFAKRVMCNMAIYDMIKRGRTPENHGTIPSPIEIAYHNDPEKTLEQVMAIANLDNPTKESFGNFLSNNGPHWVANRVLGKNEPVQNEHSEQIQKHIERNPFLS